MKLSDEQQTGVFFTKVDFKRSRKRQIEWITRFQVRFLSDDVCRVASSCGRCRREIKKREREKERELGSSFGG